jgi:hypothetical protein
MSNSIKLKFKLVGDINEMAVKVKIIDYNITDSEIERRIIWIICHTSFIIKNFILEDIVTCV